VVVLALSLMVVTSRKRMVALEHTVSTGVSAVTAPVQSAYGACVRVVTDLVVPDEDDETVRLENAMLRRRIAELGAIKVHALELEAENRRLRRLLEFRDSVRFDTVPARVIGRDYTYLTIDRGTGADIQEQMCVLTSEGVVGRVLSVSGHTSKVLLICDSNSGLGGIVQRSRAQGIVEGDQDGRCIMKYIEASVDVRPDDLVVTSGEGGVFPKGLTVGRVRSVARRDGELFQTATVEPLANLGRLEEVLVAVAEPVGGRPVVESAAKALTAGQD